MVYELKCKSGAAQEWRVDKEKEPIKWLNLTGS
jgi:hypothetical protein